MQGAERNLILGLSTTRTGAPMPVAKLSREFYERFGDKLTDELVNCLNGIEGSYRAELRDLFAAHFWRFEEKIERRVGGPRVGVRVGRHLAVAPGAPISRFLRPHRGGGEGHRGGGPRGDRRCHPERA